MEERKDLDELQGMEKSERSKYIRKLIDESEGSHKEEFDELIEESTEEVMEQVELVKDVGSSLRKEIMPEVIEQAEEGKSEEEIEKAEMLTAFATLVKASMTEVADSEVDVVRILHDIAPDQFEIYELSDVNVDDDIDYIR